MLIPSLCDSKAHQCSDFLKFPLRYKIKCRAQNCDAAILIVSAEINIELEIADNAIRNATSMLLIRGSMNGDELGTHSEGN